MHHPARPTRARKVSVAASDIGNETTSGSFNKLPPIYQDVIRRHSCRNDQSAIDAQRTADKAGLGLSTLWREVALKRFAPPIRLSERRVAWLAHEVDAILEAKRLMSRVHGMRIDLCDFVAALIEVSTNRTDSIA
ncbi:MAG: AlpA family phage regulatory protein [Paraburkholderia sp.]|nr:MAG: AlpA family phage regulatory protein [Paraburkholderia sp.]